MVHHIKHALLVLPLLLGALLAQRCSCCSCCCCAGAAESHAVLVLGTLKMLDGAAVECTGRVPRQPRSRRPQPRQELQLGPPRRLAPCWCSQKALAIRLERLEEVYPVGGGP